MSTEIKVVGSLVFQGASELREAGFEVEEDDESSEEVEAMLEDCIRREGNVMTFDLRGSLTSDANLWLQEWLGEVAEAAVSGHIDSWQEGFEPNKFVRIHAGGKEEQLEGAVGGTG